MATARFVDGYANSGYGCLSKFFDVLQVPYGAVILTGYTPALIYHLENGRNLLNEMVEKQIIARDEADDMEKAMVRARLHKDAKTVFDSLRQENPQDGFVPTFHFEVCVKTRCAKKLAHGHIIRNDGALVATDGIFTLEQGFEICDMNVQSGLVDNVNAMQLFQQMRAANLATDHDELEKRYLGIPEETRRALEQEAFNDTPLVTIILG